MQSQRVLPLELKLSLLTPLVSQTQAVVGNVIPRELDELIDLIHDARESSCTPPKLNQDLAEGEARPVFQDSKERERLG